jgi:UDP-N-acetylglucosamine 2-epimerase (non-hydrolysing)
MQRIACAVRELARSVPGLELVWSLHPNPAVARPVRSVLDGASGVRLIPPPDYVRWARLMAEADLILTDSGGIQEEAPALGLPVLILRESTERPEVVACGAGRLVGTEVAAVVAAARELLTDPGAYRTMAQAGSPFGDGRASRRIVDALLRRFAGEATLPEAFATVAPHPVD